MNRLLALVVLLALTAGPLAARPPKRAEEDLTPEERIAEDIAKLRKKAADKHRALARWCKSKKLKRTAIGHLRLALHLAPELSSVRVDLGYRKSGGEWVLKRPPDLEKLKDEGDLSADYVTRDAEIRVLRWRGLLEIADEARELGLASQADELQAAALRLSPQQPEIRQKLGHTQIGGRWFSAEEAAAVPKTVQCQQIEVVSPIAQKLSIRLNTWRAGPWTLEWREGQEASQYMLEAARRAEGLCALMLTGQPPATRTVGFITTVLDDRALFLRFLEGSGLPEARVAVIKETNQLVHSGRHVLGFALTPDFLVHKLGAVTMWRQSEGVPSWLISGVTDYLSERVLGTMITSFVTVERSAGVRRSAAKTASERWRLVLRNLALLEEDPKCGILFSSSLTGLTRIDVMKAWSLVTYLYERDAEAFVGFAKETILGDTTQALRTSYDMSPDIFDAAWRQWIIENG